MSMDIVIGDVHADIPSKYEYQDGNYILQSCIQVLNNIINYGESICATRYIFLGDIHEIKDKLPNSLKNPIIDVFKRLAKKSVFIIEGNHDKKGSDSSIKFLEPYAKIIREPIVLGNKLLIPYDRDVDKITDSINKFKDQCDIILGHFEIQGCNYGGITDSTNGVPLKVFGDKTVIAGHIHKFQWIHGGVYHLGSIYQVDWGEHSEKKYFCIIEDDDVIKFRVLPMMVNRVDFMYGDSLEPKVDKVLTGSFNMARIRYESRSTNLKDLNEYKKQVKSFGFDTVSTEPYNVGVIKKLVDNKKENIDSVFRKFIDESLEEIKVVKTKVLYREIINEVINENS